MYREKINYTILHLNVIQSKNKHHLSLHNNVRFTIHPAGLRTVRNGNQGRREPIQWSWNSLSIWQKTRVSYRRAPYLPFQQKAEPVYNLIRIRNNEQTAQRDQGIGAGTRKLEYISAPLYLKLNFTERIAIMAGLDFNFLMNDNRYKLNNGENAFRHQPRTGYSLGAEIGGLYFRYRKFNRTTNIVENWTAAIEQYQLGYKFDLF